MMKQRFFYLTLTLVMGKSFLAYGNSVSVAPTPSPKQEINTQSSWFPPHLRGAAAFSCPDKLKEFAEKYGGKTIYLMDDKDRCDRSLRRGPDIFVNTRTTYWDSMVLPPWSCKSPQEAILQRFLHEVGHIASDHRGDPAIKSTKTGLKIAKLQNVWESLKGQEGEAWRFCFKIRDQQPETYRELLQAVEKWYENHKYSDKNWVDDPIQQWKNWNKDEIQIDSWAVVPGWVKQEFSKQEISTVGQ